MIRPAALWRHEPLRFLVAGSTNTLLTLVFYWLLLTWFRYPVAYTLSFVSGVLSGYALNTYLVFRTHWSWVKLMTFPSVQGVNYVCGLVVIWVAVHWLHVSPVVAPILSTLVILPVNFLLTRRLIKGRPGPADRSTSTD